ncbi:neural cell adhesion molecule 2-like [Haemaphysalis longicornis]
MSETAGTATFTHAPRNYECEATGSRPPANVTWFLDGQPLDPTLSQITFQENVTTSMLFLPVTVRERKLLECRATNGKLPESRGVVSQFLKMDLSQRMEVRVGLGSRLNGSNINEGDDVYMECSVLAASPVTEISWRQDGRELKTGDNTPGLLVSSRFLVIQNVALSNAGRYTCRATSADGEAAESAPFELRIRHRPRCRATQVRTFLARTNETMNVSCDVRADPDDGLRYLWVAEDDAGHRRRSWKASSSENADGDQVHEVGSSWLEVLVDAFLFHATLYCWAKNDVGTQREPCRYRFTLRRKGSVQVFGRIAVT